MKLNPDIVFRQEFDGTGLLFDPNDGSSFYLNRVSALICQCLENNMDMNAILNTLRDKVANVPDSLQEQVQAFINQLEQHHFILNEI